MSKQKTIEIMKVMKKATIVGDDVALQRCFKILVSHYGYKTANQLARGLKRW